MAEIPMVVVAESQSELREVCLGLAESIGYDAAGCGSASAVLRALTTKRADVLVLDADLPDLRPEWGGVELLRQIKAQHPELTVLVTSAAATYAQVVAAMKAGAADFLAKPFDGDEFRALLKSLMSTALRPKGGSLRAAEASRGVAGGGTGSDLIGTGAAMQRVFRLVAKVAPNRYPVLILGESGTGKEMVARAIHYGGPDRDRPFIPVDCSTLVPQLMESELFGHVKGAFTGADASHDGLLKTAQGGTVFLDEVGELALDLQTKLLRAIQEREFRPVGGTKRVRIEARIVAATNRNLEEEVGAGRFRKDLFFRLNVVSIRLPPLRERSEDLPALIAHFLERCNAAAGREKRFDGEAWKMLIGYGWPGNVRELENCIERATALSSGPIITAADLPSPLRKQRDAVETEEGAIVPLDLMERRAIEHALAVLQNDKMLAAQKLNIGKTTLYRKLKEYALGA